MEIGTEIQYDENQKSWYQSFLDLPQTCRQVIVSIFVIIVSLLIQIPIIGLLFSLLLLTIMAILIINIETVVEKIRRDFSDPDYRQDFVFTICLLTFWIVFFAVMFYFFRV